MREVTKNPSTRARQRTIIPGLCICILLLLLVPSAAWAELSGDPSGFAQDLSSVPTLSQPLYEEGKPVVHFFYNTNCAECQKTLPYIDEMVSSHPQVFFRFHNIRESDADRELFQEFKNAYGKEFLPVPSLFIGPYVLSGYEEIVENLEDAIQLTSQQPGVHPTITSNTGGLGDNETLTIPLVIGAALVDGINPCAFAVLIFLLLSLLALDSRKKVLMVGATFIFAVFCFYFMSGLGLFTLVQSSGISTLVSLAAAAIAILAGVISLGEAVLKRKTPYLSIPESTRGIIDRWVKKGSMPAAFVLGVLVGMFELPCTGGIYIAILALLSNQMTMSEGIPFLLVYNLIFILPLIIILSLIAFGVTPEQLDRVRNEKRPYIRLAMGFVMIILGVILLLEIL